MDFGRLIRVMLAARGEEVSDLIERSGLPKSHIYRIINGETEPTTATKARVLLAASGEYRVFVEELLPRTHHRNPVQERRRGGPFPRIPADRHNTP